MRKDDNRWPLDEAFVAWNGGDIEPEVSGGLDDAKETLQVGSLVEVAVGEAVVGLAHITFGVGGGENSDGNEAQTGVGFNVFEQVFGIALGQVEIQEDKVGARRLGVSALAAEEEQRLIAIARDTDVDGRIDVAQGFAHESDIRRVVFNDEDLSVVQQERELQVAFFTLRWEAEMKTDLRE